MIYRFEECELDVGRIVLRRAGEVIAIEPQVFDLLSCLIERRGQVVTKEEILDTVWGDRFVSESALTSRIKTARRAIGDDGTAQRIIRTAHGKGYEFIAPVEETDAADSANPLDVVATSTVATSTAATTRRSPIPLAVNELIGRDDDLDHLVRQITEVRLLTIVGPAGVGKTAIGLELARRIADDHRDGVALVELASVGSHDEALDAVATALDVSVRQNESIDAAIVDLLRSQELLLVIDNCEHLLEPVAELLEQILQTAPDVTVLATSREALAIAGEQVFHAEPLEVYGLAALPLDELAAAPAVSLFVERARAADARFELGPANASAVAEICMRLDGIPLALELAASRTAALDVADIARRLDERLRLLKAVRRGADRRHSTLHDAINWSYDLLDDDEQRLFARLAVFAGPFDLEAVESVCDGDDVLDLLPRLSERSMISVRRPASGGTRYEMLETLREFGRSRLDDMSNVELFSRHAEHFARVAADVALQLQTVDEPTAVAAVDRSFADLRAAQRFAVEVGDADTAFGLITSIREYAMRTMRYEVFTWADSAAPLGDGAVHPLRPLLTAIRAYGSFVRGEFERSRSLALNASEDQRAQGADCHGLVHRVLGNVLYIMGDLDRAIEHNDELIPIAEASGNLSQRAHAYYMSSISAASTDRLDEAATRYELAFDMARQSGSPTDMASAWTAKGFATRDDDEAALDAFAAGDRLARSAGNRWMSAFACTEASALRVCMGDLERGSAGLAETVAAWSRAGDWGQQWLTLSRCVTPLVRIGQEEFAAELLGGIEEHATLAAPPVMPTVAATALATKESLSEGLGEGRLAELAERGARAPIISLVDRTRDALLGRAVAT